MNPIIKKLTAGLVLLAICTTSWSQQKPHYTQYILNQYILNPAITGIENYTDIKLSHRHQWVGIEDAPVTSYFTFHTPIGKKDDRMTATSFNMEGINPRGNSYWDNYVAAEPHHGVGIQVINDRTGPITHLSAYATYAYHMGITGNTSLAAGFGVGVNRTSLDASKLDITPVDPAVYNSGVLNQMKPDLMAGLYLYSADFFIGVSAQQILAQKVDFSNGVVTTDDNKLIPHMFATAGYRFLAGEDFNIIPSVMVKYLTNMPTQFDVNTKIQYRDLAWVGAGYRYKDGFNGMVGVNFSNKVNIGYSYDYTTSRLRNYSKGTHEFVLGFILGNSYGDSCPRNVW